MLMFQAVESMLLNQVVDCIWQELNISNVHDGKQTMKQHKGFNPFYTSIFKDHIATKQGHLESIIDSK